MINNDFREALSCAGYEDSVVFDGPEFDDAIIGVTTDGRVVYDFDLMVRQFAEENECEDIDAIDFIEYNTIRSLGYVGNDAPIVMYSIDSVL